MSIQSILPSPVGAELSGAGSFFGSCQVDANTFVAALNQAQAGVGEKSLLSEEGASDLQGVGSEMSVLPSVQDMERLPSIIEALLGSEVAEEYLQIAPMLDTDSLEAQLPDGEVSLEALNLVLQQLVVQLEQLLTQVLDPELSSIQGMENVEWLKNGEISSLQAKIQHFIPSLNEWFAIQNSGDMSKLGLVMEPSAVPQEAENSFKAIPVEPSSIPKETPPSEKEAQAQTLAQMLSKTAPAEPVRSMDTEGDPESESEGEASKPESPAKPALNATHQAPTTETVIRLDGGELKLQTVDARTGSTLQSTPVVDQQQRIQDLEVVRQVADKVRFLASQGTQQMSLHLSPEHLGSVHLKVSLQAGEMQIHAVVETEMAQRALESNISSLRESLEKQGISLDGLEVSVERQKNEASSFADSRQNGQGRSRGKRQSLGGEGRLIQTHRLEGAETGRRLGYNTMEYLA